MHGCNDVRGITMHGCNCVKTMTMPECNGVKSMTRVITLLYHESATVAESEHFFLFIAPSVCRCFILFVNKGFSTLSILWQPDPCDSTQFEMLSAENLATKLNLSGTFLIVDWSCLLHERELYWVRIFERAFRCMLQILAHGRRNGNIEARRRNLLPQRLTYHRRKGQ